MYHQQEPLPSTPPHQHRIPRVLILWRSLLRATSWKLYQSLCCTAHRGRPFIATPPRARHYAAMSGQQHRVSPIDMPLRSRGDMTPSDQQSSRKRIRVVESDIESPPRAGAPQGGGAALGGHGTIGNMEQVSHIYWNFFVRIVLIMCVIIVTHYVSVSSQQQPHNGVVISLASSSDEDDMWVRPRIAPPALLSGNTAGPHRQERSGQTPSIDREQRAPVAVAEYTRRPSNPVPRTNIVRGRSRPEVKHQHNVLMESVRNTFLHSQCEDSDVQWYSNVLRYAGVHTFQKRWRITHHLQAHHARNLGKTLRHSIDLQS